LSHTLVLPRRVASAAPATATPVLLRRAVVAAATATAAAIAKLARSAK
jgi:hypothetical protein